MIFRWYRQWKCSRGNHELVSGYVPTNNPLALDREVKCVHCSFKKIVGRQYFFD